MKLKALLLLALLAVLALSVTTTESAADPIIRVQHRIEVQDTSGAVYLNTTVTITNPSNDSTLTIPQFDLAYPVEMAPYIAYHRSTASDGSSMLVEEIVEENLTFYTVDLDAHSTISPSSSFSFNFFAYAHSLVNLTEYEATVQARVYNMTVAEYPTFREDIDSIDVTMTFPSEIRPAGYPPYFTKVGTYGPLELELENVTANSIQKSLFQFTSGGMDYIALVYVDAVKMYHIGENGGVHVADELTFINEGIDEVFQIDEVVRYNRPANASNFKASTTLGRVIGVRDADTQIEVTPPYALSRGERFSFLFEYDLPRESPLKGWLVSEQPYHISVETNLNYLVRDFRAELYSPDGDLITTLQLEDVTAFHVEDLGGDVTISVFGMASGSFRPLALAVVALFTLFAGYRLTTLYLGGGGVSKEMMDYITQVRFMVEAQEELISVEEDYKARKIRGKAYVRRKSELNRKLGEASSKLSSMEVKLQKVKGLSEAEERILDRRREFSELQGQLRKLERSFSKKKVSFEEYKNQKTELTKSIKDQLRDLEIDASRFRE